MKVLSEPPYIVLLFIKTFLVSMSTFSNFQKSGHIMLLSLSISFPILRGLIVYIEFNRYNMIIKEPNIYVITAGANLSYINSLPPSVNNISTSNKTADKPYTMHTTKVPLYKSIFSCSNNFSSLSFGLKTLSSAICILLFYNIILYNIYWNIKYIKYIL